MELVAKLILDSDEYDAGLNNAVEEADKKGSGIGNSLAKGIGGGLKVAGAAITAASAAMVGFGSESVQVGMNFDKSMAQVAATMGKTVDDIGELRDFAQEMGSSTMFSASQAADALNYMALAGYNATQSMEMLPNVLNLAAAGDMSLAAASDMVTDAQTALGIQFEDMGTVIDQMAKTASTTNTSVSQLGDAFLTIGATARNMKGGTVELSQVLGVLADNGIKASEGGTHLRNALLSLQTPTTSGTAALAKLGMTYEDMYDSAGNMRALPEIFLEMQKRMEGMDQASKDAIVSGVFNKADLAAVNALIGTSADRWAEVEAAITDSAGAAEKMAGTQMDNLTGDITYFKSALEGAQIAISDKLTPTLRDFVSFGTDGLSKLTEAFKEGGLTGAMSVFGELLSNGLTMLIEKLPMVIDAGAQLLGALGKGLIDNLPTLTSAAVEIVKMLSEYIVEALPPLIQAGFDVVIELGKGISEALPDLMVRVSEMIVAIGETLTNPENLTGLLQAGVDIIIAIANGLLNALPVLIDALPTIFDNLINAVVDSLPILIDGVTQLINALTTKLPDIVRKIGEKLPQIMRSIVNGITKALPVLIDGAITLVQGLVQALPEIIRALVEALPEIISGVVNALVETLPVLVNGVVQLFVGVVEALPEIMQIFAEIAPQILTMVIDALMENLPVLIQGIVDMQMALWEHLPEIMKALIDAIPQIMSIAVTNLTTNLPILLNGIVKIFATIAGTVVNAAAGIFTQVTTTIKNWWNQQKTDIEGGFNLFIEDFKNWLEDLPYNLGVAFGNMIKKFIEWKDDALNWVKTELPKIIDAIVEWFVDLPSKIKEFFTEVIDDFKNWSSDMIDMIKEEVPKIIDEIASFFDDLPDMAMQWGNDLASSFSKGITDKVGTVKNAASNFANGIKSVIHFSVPDEGPLADFDTYAPDMMDLFAKGILDNEDKVVRAVERAFDFGDTIISSSDNVSGVTAAPSGLITPTAGRNLTVVFEMDKEQFGKVVYRLNNDEVQRVGVDLGKEVVS